MAETNQKMPQLAASFWKTITNQSAPGSFVDMYLVHDEPTGEGIVSVAVPHGRKDIVDRIVSAWNSHDDLLKAAKRALTVLKAQGESVRSGNVLGALEAAITKAEPRP